MYVIKSERLKNFLFALGFHCEAKPNKYIEGKYVYLFTKSKELFEAITFYTEFRKKQKH
ncbi:hypothetical protein [Clostridium tetani]|uniref:hypothetical protein n=1 Tax=Clostridium tetani TaxID=1513 RepID=UPI0003C0C8B5|nr:hypothetical protein [Clostridium tetani]CDI50390.1 hypothetical protein BN906_02406 [Clostridium tetani 12124569]